MSHSTLYHASPCSLNVVIYISLRIEKEGLTKGELEQDLSLVEEAIELQTGDGTYSKVATGKGSEWAPIAVASATPV